MDINNLRENVYNSMVSVQTVGENINILDKFTKEEIYDIVNVIVVNLPKYPDQIITTINERVLNGISVVNKHNQRQTDIKKLLRLFLARISTREQNMLLISLLLIEHTFMFDNNITNELQNVLDYYVSHIIHNSTELQEEIVDNPIIAQTQVIGHSYLRVDELGNLIPTRNTLENFKQYLINL